VELALNISSSHKIWEFLSLEIAHSGALEFQEIIPQYRTSLPPDVTLHNVATFLSENLKKTGTNPYS